jgi:hypothetical protein
MAGQVRGVELDRVNGEMDFMRSNTPQSALELLMKRLFAFIVVVGMSTALPFAQEKKPVPKDSVRVAIPGCTKGSVFTSGPRTSDQPGSVDIPEGMHVRMTGPKDVMKEIKAHEGSMIEITGLMRKGQFNPDGVHIGGGVRVSPGAAPVGGSVSPAPVTNQMLAIDVEGWRPAVGECPSR